jgi:serine/threonine protein kinase/Tol biopolymer transport system component
MTLTPGTKLGPYEIVSPLGGGGMGEVYRARDTRLGRDVAIKVLPEGLTRDEDRLWRFQQEARVIATLNHPNILGIHDIGTHEGAPYLVSEFLEGTTLREKLDTGPLPVRRAIEYALGIAQGLAAAHDKGIVHRDLKPENLFITRDGRVKVLDFGLAKLVRPDERSETAVTLPSATLPGMVLGTVGYMSPEQVRGESSDARSDIFSFGAVLYEMLTGKRAFKRETSAETMTAVLREEPAQVTEAELRWPLGLQRILCRCLEKNVERRFQSASDLAFAIESLSDTSSAALQTVAKPKARLERRAATIIAAIALIVGVWFAGRSSIRKVSPTFTRLTFQRGFLSNARFAKGGDAVVYSAQWNNEPMQIYSVRMEFPQSVKADLPSAAMLALSTTGDLTVATDPAYRTGFLSGTMAQVQMAGGSPRLLETAVISADYAPDVKTMAVVRHANRKVQLEYPAGHVIYTTAGYLDYVRVSPSGEQVAFLDHPVYDDDRGWVAVMDSSGNYKRLTEEFAGGLQGLAWSRDGAEVWFSAAAQGADLAVFAVSLSGKQRTILETPQRTRLLDIAPDGRVLLSNEEYRREVVGIDPATRKERRSLEWFNASGMVDVFKDGKSILFVEFGGPAGPFYMVAYRKLDGTAPVALGPGAWPKFSPDGTMAVALVLSQPPQVALHPIGTGESRRLPLGEIVNVVYVSWFPDGKHLMLVGSTEGQPLRSYEMDLEGGKPQPLGPPDFAGKAVARDGRRIAGRNAAGEAVVFSEETQSVHVIPGVEPHEQFDKWTEDGQALLVSSGTPWEAHLERIEVVNGKRTLLEKVELADRAGSNLNVGLTYAEEGKTYVYNTRRILGTLYVVDGLQ